MKVSEAIALAKELKPCVFDDDTLIQWLNEAEGLVQTEVLGTMPEDIVIYDAGDSNATLLAAPPHDKLYYMYLMALIDFAHGEYTKYANTMKLFNSGFSEFAKWHARTGAEAL